MKKLSLITAITILFCSLTAHPSVLAFGGQTNTNGTNSSTESAPPQTVTASPAPGSSSPAPASSSPVTGSSSPAPDSSAAPATTAPSPEPTDAPGIVRAGTKEAQVLKVPILLYHHISDEFDNSNAISIISPKDFRLHMTAIKAQFTPVSLKDYVEFVNCTDGTKTMPSNPIIVTFDDGYLSNYEVAYPILKELDIPATIFIVTDTVGAKSGEGKVNYTHFNWAQAREMQNSGIIDIQSHTNDHVKLGTISKDAVNFELRKSKYLIEKNLGKTCDMIAYPFGSYSDSIIEASRKAGYTAQCLVGDDATVIDYEVNIPRDGVEHMTRITVSGLMGNVNIIELVRKALANKITE